MWALIRVQTRLVDFPRCVPFRYSAVYKPQVILGVTQEATEADVDATALVAVDSTVLYHIPRNESLRFYLRAAERSEMHAAHSQSQRIPGTPNSFRSHCPTGRGAFETGLRAGLACVANRKAS